MLIAEAAQLPCLAVIKLVACLPVDASLREPCRGLHNVCPAIRTTAIFARSGLVFCHDDHRDQKM
jgi:hypothetical protein